MEALDAAKAIGPVDHGFKTTQPRSWNMPLRHDDLHTLLLL